MSEEKTVSNAIESGMIRPEKFVEDNLAEICEVLRVELAAKKQTIEELTAKLADYSQRWAALNSEVETLRIFKKGVMGAAR